MTSKPPRIYTMPEQFMGDTSVPVKWRLYGHLNGFWIGGRTVYATNEYFAKALGCTERNIQMALAELERDGLVTRNVQGFKRLILPGGTKPDFTPRSPISGGGEAPLRQEHEAPLRHIAVSNAVNITGGEPQGDNSYVIVADAPTKRTSTTPKSEVVFLAFKEFTGRYPLNWKQNRTERQAAENLMVERGEKQIRRALEFYRENKSNKFCPTITKPTDLDRKWGDLSEFREKNGG